jgi:hypothetical protein
VTLKFIGTPDVGVVVRAKQLLAAHAHVLAEADVKKMSHNKNEVTIFGTRSDM